MKFFKRILIGYYENYDDFSEHQNFIVINLLSILGFLFHLVYFIYFINTKFEALIYFNALSTSLYLFFFLVNRKKNYKTASDIITLEIISYSIYSSYYLGIGAFPIGFILIALMPHFLFLGSNSNKRLFYSALGYIAFNLTYFIFKGSAYNIEVSETFKLLNSNIVFLTIIFELNFSGFVEKLVKNSYEKDLKIAKEEAFIDPLTKLYNRRYFEKYSKEIKLEVNKDISVCIAMIDIDFFKVVNDTYGHSFGDEVLVYLSNQMVSNFRKYDKIFRFGGEEFLIVFKDADIYESERYVERFRSNFVKSPIKHKDKEIDITFTTGICHYEKTMDLSKCIEIADKRLYYGKKNGKNQVVISIPEV